MHNNRQSRFFKFRIIIFTPNYEMIMIFEKYEIITILDFLTITLKMSDKRVKKIQQVLSEILTDIHFF